MTTNRFKTNWTMRIAAVTALAIVGLAYSTIPGAADARRDQVDEVFKRWNTNDSPGCAVAVVKDGNVVYKSGYGMADLEHNVPIKSSTVFHAASLAKQFTAMAVMLLVKDGKLSLDDDVRTYVKEFPLPGITVGDMLRHLSGIRDQWALLTMAGWRLSDDLITRDDVLGVVSRMKALNFKEPRDGFSYSNTNYTLAGLIVERVSGQSLADFARDKIFSPLGMSNTQYYVTNSARYNTANTSIGKTPGPVVPNRAYGYRIKDETNAELRMPNYDLTGPTNLLTTVEDLARWDRNFDDMTVGGNATLKQMQKPGMLSNNKPAVVPGDEGDVNYGLGLMIAKYKRHDIVEHSGQDPGHRSHLMRFPDKHLAVACLCNVQLPDDTPARELARQVADVFLADEFGLAAHHSRAHRTKAAHQRVRPADMADYLGTYYSEEIDTTYKVEMKDSLVITRRKYPDTELNPLSGNKFGAHFSPVLSDATVEFTREDGTVIGLLVSDNNPDNRIRNFEFKKRSQ